MADEKWLIDANKAQAVLVNMAEHLMEAGNPEMAGAVGYAAEVIGKQRTVDAVEVVRCEECQSWDTKHCADGQGWCPKVCGYRHGGWFCAAGKRKTITDQTMKALEAMDKNAHGGADDGKT